MYNVQESLSIINCTSSLISYANDDRVSYSYHSTYRRRRDSDSAVHYYIPHGSINITQNDTDPYLPAVTKFRRISVVSLFPVCDPRYRSRGFFPSIDCMSWLPFKWDLVHAGQTECQFGGIQFNPKKTRITIFIFSQDNLSIVHPPEWRSQNFGGCVLSNIKHLTNKNKKPHSNYTITVHTKWLVNVPTYIFIIILILLSENYAEQYNLRQRSTETCCCWSGGNDPPVVLRDRSIGRTLRICRKNAN